MLSHSSMSLPQFLLWALFLPPSLLGCSCFGHRAEFPLLLSCSTCSLPSWLQGFELRKDKRAKKAKRMPVHLPSIFPAEQLWRCEMLTRQLPRPFISRRLLSQDNNGCWTNDDRELKVLLLIIETLHCSPVSAKTVKSAANGQAPANLCHRTKSFWKGKEKCYQSCEGRQSTFVTETFKAWFNLFPFGEFIITNNWVA